METYIFDFCKELQDDKLMRVERHIPGLRSQMVELRRSPGRTIPSDSSG